jgi:hypothetical protein
VVEIYWVGVAGEIEVERVEIEIGVGVESEV